MPLVAFCLRHFSADFIICTCEFEFRQAQHSVLDNSVMAEALPNDTQSETERLDVAVDQAIAACDGDLRATIRALIVANEFLEHELQTKVSQGYTRGIRHGRFNTYSG
jgi:hypothetical protein